MEMESIRLEKKTRMSFIYRITLTEIKMIKSNLIQKHLVGMMRERVGKFACSKPSISLQLKD